MVTHLLQCVIWFSWLLLALVFGVLISTLYSSHQISKQEEPVAFCGVSSYSSPRFSSDSLNQMLAHGKTLFKENCASCHARNMVDDLTGPALGGVERRWSPYPRTDLYEWIRNSQRLIDQGHPKATELWSTYQPVIMNAFSNLTDQDIESILVYIDATDRRRS